MRVKLVRADLESNRIDFVLAGSDKAYAGRRTVPKAEVKPVSRPQVKAAPAWDSLPKAPAKAGKSAARKSAKPAAGGKAKPVAKKPAAKKAAAPRSKGGGAKAGHKAGAKKR